MSLVQTNCLRLANAIDPFSKSGAEFTSGTIGTVSGKLFTAARLVDIYCQARVALQSSLNSFMRSSDGKKLKGVEISENVVRKTNLQFTAGIATIPDGSMGLILLRNEVGTKIPMIDQNLEEYITDLVDATNPGVVISGTSLVDITNTLPDASTYRLNYIAVPAYTVTDVTNGTTVESFNSKWDWSIIELSSAIANEQGEAQVLALADAIVKRVIQG